MNPPDTIMIDGRTYSWRWLCEIRRRQLDAWKAARPQQPALFDLKDDSRPAWEHNPAPSLLAWLQVYGSCSGSTSSSYELTRDNTCEESCGRGRGGVQPWAC